LAQLAEGCHLGLQAGNEGRQFGRRGWHDAGAAGGPR
jgi:hypothetical protein